MKKILLTLLTVVLISTGLYAQSEINGCLITMKNSSILSLKTDTISAAFVPGEYAWNIILTNNLNKDISVVWEKSSFILNGASSKVIFDNTLKMNKDNAVPDQVIPSSTFISKGIFPSGNFTEKYASPTISKKRIKKEFDETGQPETVKIIIAFNIDGELKKYDFNFEMIPKPKK